MTLNTLRSVILIPFWDAGSLLPLTKWINDIGLSEALIRALISESDICLRYLAFDISIMDLMPGGVLPPPPVEALPPTFRFILFAINRAPSALTEIAALFTVCTAALRPASPMAVMYFEI